METSQNQNPVVDKKAQLLFVMQGFFMYSVKNLVGFLKTKSEKAMK